MLSVCSTGPLCPFIYLCFCPWHIFILKRQFCFDSYLYVKCAREAPCHCSNIICWNSHFGSTTVWDIPLCGLTVVPHISFSEKLGKRKKHIMTIVLLSFFWSLYSSHVHVNTSKTPIPSLLIIRICTIYDLLVLHTAYNALFS